MDVRIAKPVLLSVTLLLAVHGIGLWEMIQLARALGVSIWMPYSVLAIVYGLLAGVLVGGHPGLRPRSGQSVTTHSRGKPGCSRNGPRMNPPRGRDQRLPGRDFRP